MGMKIIRKKRASEPSKGPRRDEKAEDVVVEAKEEQDTHVENTESDEPSGNAHETDR